MILKKHFCSLGSSRNRNNLYYQSISETMNCIIVDEKPIARKGIKTLVEQMTGLELTGSFNSAASASEFMSSHPVDLIFLDIQMPGITALEFAKTISQNTLIIFTTAYTEYAPASYEAGTVDYPVRSPEFNHFFKAVNKAVSCRTLLINDEKKNIENIVQKHLFVKAERRFHKVNLADILFIEGLKDYIIIQTESQRIITKTSLKTIYEELPGNQFLRVNRSYIINTRHIESFDNNDIFIRSYEIAIGCSYRETFFNEFVMKSKKL